MQRRACIASRMLSVSPRQTLRELARDHAKTKPSPSISGIYGACVYLHARITVRRRGFALQCFSLHLFLPSAQRFHF